MRRLDAQSLAELRQSLQELIDQREAVSLTDRSHKLLVRVEEQLLRELVCPIEPPTREFPHPRFPELGPRGESHPGQVTLSLLKALGPDAVIRTTRGAYNVRELIHGERFKASHYEVLATIRRCVRRAGGFPSTCLREIGSLDLDQAWYIELIARDLHLQGLPLSTEWVDEDGHLLSLLDFLRAEALLLEREHRPGEPWLLTEYGIHALSSMSVVLASFDGSEAIPPEDRVRFESLVETKSAELLKLALGDSAVPAVHRLMLAGHLLEYLLAPDTYKPCLAESNLEGVRSCGLEAPSERLLALIEQILRQSGGRGLPLGVLSHALAGVRMLAAEPSRPRREGLSACPPAAPSARSCRP